MHISDFLLAEQPIGFKEYSKYVLFSRAIPSMIDGFKPGQRKIVYTAGLDPKTFNKTAAFAGKVISAANYHHGPSSLEATINGMAASWNNNVCMMEGDGAFDSRLVPEAASPRYTSCRLSSNFAEYYPILDVPILPESKDLLDPEPEYYVPTLPTVLFNGIKGISVGFATNIFPYSIKDIKKTVKKIINGKTIPTHLIPSFPGFNGTIIRDGKGVICEGVYTVKGKIIHITELPPGTTREKYLEHLENLIVKGIISSYDDLCDRNGFHFKLRTRKISNYVKTLKLSKKYTENVTVISPERNVKEYDNVIELIKDFVEFRLSFYNKRKIFLIDKYVDTLVYDENMLNFVHAVISGEIDLRNKTKIKLVAELESIGYKYVQDLLNMSLLSLTEDKILKLKDKMDKTRKLMDALLPLTPTQMYLKEI